MAYPVCVFIAAAICFLLLLRLSIQAVPLRGRLGRNCRCCMHLSVTGREPKLAKSVCSLLWLMERGGLNCRVVIQGRGLDQETRAAALALSDAYQCITLIEDGESPWIRKTIF